MHVSENYFPQKHVYTKLKQLKYEWNNKFKIHEHGNTVNETITNMNNNTKHNSRINNLTNKTLKHINTTQIQ